MTADAWSHLPPVRAVLFDVDGTLLDTTEFIYRGFEHALATHGHTIHSRDMIAALMGKPLDVCYQQLAPDGDAELLCDTHRTWQTTQLHLAQPFAGIPETLAALHAAGLRMAAITTRSRRTSVDTLRLTGLLPFFDLVLSGEDVTHLKPHPEPLHKALTALALTPDVAVMVGDTDADVLAGRAAGTRTVGVAYGFHGERLAAVIPDVLLSNPGEMLPLLLAAARAA